MAEAFDESHPKEIGLCGNNFLTEISSWPGKTTLAVHTLSNVWSKKERDNGENTPREFTKGMFCKVKLVFTKKASFMPWLMKIAGLTSNFQCILASPPTMSLGEHKNIWTKVLLLPMTSWNQSWWWHFRIPHSGGKSGSWYLWRLCHYPLNISPGPKVFCNIFEQQQWCVNRHE